jgi:bacterioferritin-associated ferredoxin
MIVCSCNRLTDATIRAALERPDGPRCVRDVYAACGCAPVCGGCAGSIAKMLEEARADELYERAKRLQKAAA